jgi:putative flippase GtrA
MVRLIHSILDFFYPLVRRIFDKTTYYYAACGSGNLVLSWVVFFFFFNVVFKKKDFFITNLPFGFGGETISALTMSSIVCACISFLVGFMLMRYVVFTASQLRGRAQFLRYGISAIITSTTNWGLLKILVLGMGLFPSIANVLASCVVVTISYLLQRKFSFK